VSNDQGRRAVACCLVQGQHKREATSIRIISDSLYDDQLTRIHAMARHHQSAFVLVLAFSIGCTVTSRRLDPPDQLPEARVKRASVGGLALGAMAVGALAAGSAAVGALAVGAMLIGRLKVGQAEAKKLTVGRLEVEELLIGGEQVNAGDISRSTGS